MPSTVLYTVCFSDFYGTQRNILATAGRLDPQKYKPLVAAPRGEQFFSLLRKENIPVFDMPFSGVTDVATINSLRKLIKIYNVKLIHAHLGISTFLSLAAAALSEGVPVISTRHFIEDRYTTLQSRFKYKAYLNMYKRMNRHLKKTIFVSEAVKKGVESREGLFRDKGVIIPNGVDVLEGPFKEGLLPEEIDIIRDRYGIPPGKKLIVSLSRLVPEKGLDTLLESASVLKKEGREDFYFLVAGDGHLRTELEAQARKLYVSDMVRFAGYVKDVKSLLSAADVFVLCAHVEPFGIAVLEAMAVGVPVVVASAGGPLEIIKDQESGLFFDPGDAKGLSDRIVGVSDDKSFWNNLVRNARKRVMDFDEKIVARSIMKVYEEIIKR